MIKVDGKIEIEEYNFNGNPNSRLVRCDLIADNIAELAAIGDDGSTVLGLRPGDVLSFGCNAMDTSYNIAMMSSGGVWV